MNISLEEYTEEEKRLTGNMIKGGKIHDKLCDYLDSIGYKEPIINDLSVAVWKAVDIIVALKEELKRERSCVDKLVKDTPHYDECNSEDYDDEENCDCGRETDLVWAKHIQKQRKIEL